LTYGNGLGDVVTGLFTRIAPKILPVGKELASKAIGVIGKSAAIGAGIRAFKAAKNKIASLIRREKTPKKSPDEPVNLPSTADMPPKVANEINKMAKDKLNTIVGYGLKLSI
jgi:hypothetical protein